MTAAPAQAAPNAAGAPPSGPVSGGDEASPRGTAARQETAPAVRTSPHARVQTGGSTGPNAPRRDRAGQEGTHRDAARHDGTRLGLWLDEAAGPIVRPYTVSNGRTRPTADLGSRLAVAATGSTPPVRLGPEHRRVIDLCAVPRTVAEVADRLPLPVAVTKVLIGDLLDCGALTVAASHDDTERALLEAVLAGLRRAL